jgi:LmbE family N-acetylglucosaminyl deacetylase
MLITHAVNSVRAVALALVPAAALSQTVVKYISNPSADVFVVAHQDDWQVFMGDVAASRAANGAVTFIYLTAGDDGRDPRYWVARERAALRSTRVALASAGAGEMDCQWISVRDHRVRQCTLGNDRSFFLRLPDGNRNGAGFSRYGYQSMRRLRSGKIAEITSVDSSAIYRDWDDLVATVRQLIESSGQPNAVVHTMDPSIKVNPHDHFDHRIAGLIVDGLRATERWRVRYYVGYALTSRAPNRSNEQVRAKTAMFLAYDEEIQRENPKWSAYREHPAFYSQSMLRTYARSARPTHKATPTGHSPSEAIR